MLDQIIPTAVTFDNGVTATTVSTDRGAGRQAVVMVAGRRLGWIGLDPYADGVWEVWPDNTGRYVPASTEASATSAIGAVLEAHGLVERIQR